MDLQLRYEPVPENAVKFAEDIAVVAKKIDAVDLDFSIESLEAVDTILEKFHQEKVSPEDIAETLFSFGLYVGEIFVRHAYGRWRKTQETPMAKTNSFPLVIELESGKICNPIGKVFKRVESGTGDNLIYFFKVFCSPASS